MPRGIARGAENYLISDAADKPSKTIAKRNIIAPPPLLRLSKRASAMY